MRFISKEATLQAFENIPVISGLGLEPVIAMRDVKEIIKAVPEVDAVPLVHGKWEFSTIPDEMYNCSICGAGCWYYDYRAHVTKSNYCPSCGAKMDLEEQDETD